jgi:hypothetical protein
MGSVAILLTGNGTGELGRVVLVLECFQRLAAGYRHTTRRGNATDAGVP